MKRSFITIVVVLGIALAVILIRVPDDGAVHSANWLQIIDGPRLYAEKNGANHGRYAVVFTVSNASPRTLRFSVHDSWWNLKHPGERVNWGGFTPASALLAGGGTATLNTWSNGELPSASEIDWWMDIHWREEPSRMRWLVEQIEDRIPFSIWPRRPLASGGFRPYGGENGWEHLMHSTYGMVPKTTAEPSGSRPGRDHVSDDN